MHHILERGHEVNVRAGVFGVLRVDSQLGY